MHLQDRGEKAPPFRAGDESPNSFGDLSPKTTSSVIRKIELEM